MMFQSWSNRQKFFVLTVAAGLTAIASFENCSRVGFGADYGNSNLSSQSANADGIFYTNQKFVNIPVAGNLQWMDQMRASFSSDMDAAKIPWQALGSQINFDLDTEYAADGSKDGIKTVYVQVRASQSDTRNQTTVPVFLDTQAPQLNATDLLAKGVLGVTYAKGQAVTIDWTGADKVPSGGQASGFSQTEGLRWGYAYSADCSENSLSQVSAWMPYASSLSVPWPEPDPLKAFYFCVYGKDKAGNIGTLLSQPMTGIWQVLAGDNNQGNGGSVLAKSVRFGYTNALAYDSVGNLYIYDNYMSVIRKVSATDSSISHVAGSGLTGGIVVGDALATPLSGQGDMDFDGQDRLYMADGGGVIRFTFNKDGSGTVENLLSVGGRNSLAIDRKNNILYLGTFTDSTSAASSSYIYKMSIADLEKNFPSASVRPKTADLQARYIFAGNGQGLSNTVPFTDASVLASTSVDYPCGLNLGDAGEVYYVTCPNGAGYPFGHSQLRMLKADTKNVLQNYFVTALRGTLGAVLSVHIAAAKAAVEQKYVMVGTLGYGIQKVDLSAGQLPVSTSAVSTLDPNATSEVLHPNQVTAIKATYDATGKKLQGFVFTESDHSRITLMNTDLTFQAHYGREVFDAQDTTATQAMVNNPDGIAQAPNGDVYISEPLSQIIRKIDSSGQISLVAGTANVAAAQGDSAMKVSDYTFLGTGYTTGGHYALAFDGRLNRLYMTEPSQRRIREFNMTSQMVQTFAPSTAKSGVFSWAPSTIALPPSSTKKNDLYVWRGSTKYGNIGANVQKYDVAAATANIFAGNETTGVPTNGVLATNSPLETSVFGAGLDSKLNYYFSGSGAGTYVINSATGIIEQLSKTLAFQGLQVIEVGSDTHIIGSSSSGLVDLKIAANGTITSTPMCLPGTNLSRALQITVATDGNLLIADAHNDRVLKYFLYDKNNSLRILDQNCQ